MVKDDTLLYAGLGIAALYLLNKPLKDVGESVASTMGGVGGGLSTGVQGLGGGIADISSGVGTAFIGTGEAVSDVAGDVAQVTGGVADFITDIPSTTGKILKGIGAGIRDLTGLQFSNEKSLTRDKVEVTPQSVQKAVSDFNLIESQAALFNPSVNFQDSYLSSSATKSGLKVKDYNAGDYKKTSQYAETNKLQSDITPEQLAQFSKSSSVTPEKSSSSSKSVKSSSSSSSSTPKIGSSASLAITKANIAKSKAATAAKKAAGGYK